MRFARNAVEPYDGLRDAGPRLASFSGVRVSSRFTVRSSWVAIALLSGGLSGCPDDDDCTEPNESVEPAPAETDPNLATFEGTFTWLQTGDETTLRFSTSRAASLGTKRCGHTAMEVNHELETTDGLVAVEVSRNRPRPTTDS